MESIRHIVALSSRWIPSNNGSNLALSSGVLWAIDVLIWDVPSCMFVVYIQHQILNAIRSLQFPIKDTPTGIDRKSRHTMAVGV